MWTALAQNIFGEKEKKKPQKVRPRDGHVDHVSKFEGLYQKQRGRLDFCVA